MNRSALDKAVKAGQLREIDLHAALFVNRLARRPSADLLLAAALASRAVGEGHICLPLEQLAARQVFTPDIHCPAPELASWRRSLMDSGAVDSSESDAPLVLDDRNRLYLSRYFRYEQRIAAELLRRSRGMLAVDREAAALLLAQLFPDSGKNDWQQVAVTVAALKKFVVISGGPGTGKTYTVARLLSFLQNLAGGSLRIGLVAPTGKAAVRLEESIRNARQTMPDDLAAMVPTSAETLHRLLGFVPGTGRFRHDSRNRLHLDLLVIDEASMVDVPLMAALLEALPERTRIIMLGDRDQLTSVEAGSLFGDICSTTEPGWSAGLCAELQVLAGWSPTPACPGETFGDSIVLLREHHRFSGAGGIPDLARAVNGGDIDFAAAVLGKRYDDLEILPPDHGRRGTQLEEHILAGFKHCFDARSPSEALQGLDDFRILCAVREGPGGVGEVNRVAEELFRRQGYIADGDQRYRGRPLIIRSNHYGMRLFNGDTGVIWPDGSGKLRAWFGRPEGTLQQVPLSRLPAHDTAYAITVHQSQGSEFNRVLFLLPDVDSRVLTRELLYTGITRARQRLVLAGDHDLLEKAVGRRVVRYSGLGEKLWKSDAECC